MTVDQVREELVARLEPVREGSKAVDPTARAFASGQTQSSCWTRSYRRRPRPASRRLPRAYICQMISALYVVLMIAVVVGVDLLFFRHRFWERLMVNIGIVLVTIQLSRQDYRTNVGDSGNCESVKRLFSWGGR